MEAVLEEAVLEEAEPNEVRLRGLEAEIVAVAGRIHAEEARLVGLLSEFDELDGAHGYTSLAQFLSVRAGFTMGDARRRCVVAEAAGRMPTVMARAEEGRISVGVVAMAARAGDGVDQAYLAEVCTLVSPTQAARLVGACKRIDEARPPSEEPVEPEEWSTWWKSSWDEQGRKRISAALDPETGALIDAAYAAAIAKIDRLRDELVDEPLDAVPAGPDPDLGEPDLVDDARTDVRPKVSALEAVRLLAQTMLDAADDDRVRDRGGEHFSVVLSADLTELSTLLPGESHAHGCRLVGSGTPVPVDTVRRLTCDCKVQALLHQARHGLAMGREIRVVNRHQRRALRIRDGGCRYPGCGQTRWVDAHHIVHWTNGGLTDLDNLVLLCRKHHRLFHEGGWTIHGDPTDPTGLEFRDPRWKRWGTPTVHAPPDHLAPVISIDPDAARPTAGGERLTHWAADMLVARLLTA